LVNCGLHFSVFLKTPETGVTIFLLRHCELKLSVASSFLQGLTIPRKKSNAQLTIKSYNFFIRIKTTDRDRQKHTYSIVQGTPKKTYLPTISTGAYSMPVSASRQTSAQFKSFDEQINHTADYSKSPD